jgi:hypothetical protein
MFVVVFIAAIAWTAYAATLKFAVIDLYGLNAHSLPQDASHPTTMGAGGVKKMSILMSSSSW